NMQNEKISLIIPAYNEASIISDTIGQAMAYLDNNFCDYELIIADDGSTDNTRELVEAIPNSRLRCVSYKLNRGKGCAVREGVLAATGDIIVYTDADLAYGLEAVGELVAKLKSSGAGAAIGSRKLHPEGYRDYPPIRLLASRVFGIITGLMSGFHYDTQCGLKAFTAPAAREIFSRCENFGFAFDFEVMMLSEKLGISVAQLPVMIINHRDSKVRVIRDSIKMFGDIIKIRRSVSNRMKEEGRK
ncbi:MAG: glycosyltransferase, partial [Oscillospiraceae bacterium]